MFADWLPEEISSYLRPLTTDQPPNTNTDTSPPSNAANAYTTTSSASFVLEGLGGRSWVDLSGGPYQDSPDSWNWASEDNRVGRGVLNGVRSQGSCGACWAFAATAATEASIVINALDHTSRGEANRGWVKGRGGGLESGSGENFFGGDGEGNGGSLSGGENSSSRSEGGSNLPSRPMVTVSLSVQEIIDCDVSSGDLGCRGGSPALAYSYIMAHGLALWDQYPFIQRVSVTLY